MDRREFLTKAAALAGTLFLADCGGTPERPKVYGVDVEAWNKSSPEERGNHVWKFLTTPAKDERKEQDRLRLFAQVNGVIERAEKKNTNEHTVLHYALDGALKKNYARFILHYYGQGVNLYSPQDRETDRILEDRKAIVSSPAFLSSASQLLKREVTQVAVNYHESSSYGTTYASRVTMR